MSSKLIIGCGDTPVSSGATCQLLGWGLPAVRGPGLNNLENFQERLLLTSELSFSFHSGGHMPIGLYRVKGFIYRFVCHLAIRLAMTSYENFLINL